MDYYKKETESFMDVGVRDLAFKCFNEVLFKFVHFFHFQFDLWPKAIQLDGHLFLFHRQLVSNWNFRSFKVMLRVIWRYLGVISNLSKSWSSWLSSILFLRFAMVTITKPMVTKMTATPNTIITTTHKFSPNKEFGGSSLTEYFKYLLVHAKTRTFWLKKCGQWWLAFVLVRVLMTAGVNFGHIWVKKSLILVLTSWVLKLNEIRLEFKVKTFTLFDD